MNHSKTVPPFLLPSVLAVMLTLEASPAAATEPDSEAPLQPSSDSIAEALALPPVPPPQRAPDLQVRLLAEGGSLATLSNYGVFGANGTRVDFRSAAGQDNLALYTRWSAEFEFLRRHTLVFLYQPLSTVGVRTPSDNERYEGVTFAAGQPVRTEFGFPFYRLSYLYQIAGSRQGYLSLGFTGQIRNANYTFTRLDGEAFARTSSVGFVPALKVRGELNLSRSTFVGLEADGIYAPISVLNGSTNETVGAILDASVRAGVRVRPDASAFLSVRYLGGGATNTDPDNYAKNWLHFLFIGIGASIDLVPSQARPRFR